MPANPQNICAKLAQNRFKTAIIMAVLAGIFTFLIEKYFDREININLPLSLGTAIFTFIAIFILHYIIFSKLRNVKWQYFFLFIFPFFYFAGLITAFGTVTALINLTLYQVPFVNQVYLQGWAFLGQAFIYAAFSSKLAIFITCLIVWLSFFCTLKNHTIQTQQD